MKQLTFKEFVDKYFEADKKATVKYRGTIYYYRYYRLTDRYVFSNEDVENSLQRYNETGQEPY